MEQRDMVVYEPPMLVEVGDFDELTCGAGGNTGWDGDWYDGWYV